MAGEVAHFEGVGGVLLCEGEEVMVVLEAMLEPACCW